MKPTTELFERREQSIAGLLWYGTWIASALVAAGIALSATHDFWSSLVPSLRGYDVVKSGVALFIILPVARVALMLAMSLRERDYVYIVISVFVLAVIAAGVVVVL
ncbi:hypothetical protein BHS06_08130 [Myxococcus xanthus]|uniref:DUF1634 domain-containing protein n=1 Tax=Myxococcus xanthus TaxID=34 RepID=UPI00112AE383|nr:DUF1634 domain-containing protein [Myxococcus xanthus]QDE88942.1 hypothetical protein BHS06_08130 [Myxococcus xanthus]